MSESIGVDKMPLVAVTVYGPVGEYGATEEYQVGRNMGEKWGRVTEICIVGKNGMYCDIPYVQVWCGDRLHAEFCQHNVQAVYFRAALEETDD